MSKKANRARSGFTLVEILLVVVIIGILSTIVVTVTIGKAGKARREMTRVQIEHLKGAVVRFEMEVGRMPKDLQELVFEGDANWPGPFLDSEEVPTDAWGNAFRYEMKGKRLRISSPGRDSQWGTDDDLWN